MKRKCHNCKYYKADLEGFGFDFILCKKNHSPTNKVCKYHVYAWWTKLLIWKKINT